LEGEHRAEVERWSGASREAAERADAAEARADAIEAELAALRAHSAGLEEALRASTAGPPSAQAGAEPRGPTPEAEAAAGPAETGGEPPATPVDGPPGDRDVLLERLNEAVMRQRSLEEELDGVSRLVGELRSARDALEAERSRLAAEAERARGAERAAAE